MHTIIIFYIGGVICFRALNALLHQYVIDNWDIIAKDKPLPSEWQFFKGYAFIAIFWPLFLLLFLFKCLKRN